MKNEAQRAKSSDELVLEVGSLILNSHDYSQADWNGIAVVGYFFNGERSQSGYVYLSNGKFEARTPGIPVLRKIAELHKAMKAQRGEEWHQCLIHITRPDLKFNMQFEYDDPRRWSPKKVSMDMSDYAESIKPPSMAASGQDT